MQLSVWRESPRSLGAHHEQNDDHSLRCCRAPSISRRNGGVFGACLEDADAAFIAKALGDIARAKGMAQVAKEAGLSRESLYKALSGERSPDFETILNVVGALGLKLHAKAATGKSRGLVPRSSGQATKRRVA